jgi:hypothetical protein
MSSDSDWDDSSEEYFYPTTTHEQEIIPEKPLNAREKFIQRIQNLQKKPLIVFDEEELPSKSAADLLDEYKHDCQHCGVSLWGNADCSCGAEFQAWVENKTMVKMTMEPTQMSWKQLTDTLQLKQSEQTEQSIDNNSSEEYNLGGFEASEDGSSEANGWSEIEWPDLDVQCVAETPQNDTTVLLQNELNILVANSNALIAERECLIAQLQQCEERLEDVQEQQKDIKDEIASFGQTALTNELLAGLDEFSQAIQILLSTEEYYDINDLIGQYAVGGDSPDDIKKDIIIDAKLYKKTVLMGETNMEPLPKNKDGLPYLHDTYLTDSYRV